MATDDDTPTHCHTVTVTMTKSSSCMSSTSASSHGTNQTSDEAVPSIKADHREVHRVKFAEEKNEYCNLPDSRPSSAVNDNYQEHEGEEQDNHLADGSTNSSSGTRPPIIKTPRPRSPESFDNPFMADGELSRKADYIILYSKFSRTEIRIADPDLLDLIPSRDNYGVTGIEVTTPTSVLTSTNLGYTPDSSLTTSPSTDLSTETVGFVVAGLIAPEKALPVMMIDTDYDELRPTTAASNGAATVVLLKTDNDNVATTSSPSSSTSSLLSHGPLTTAPSISQTGAPPMDKSPDDKIKNKGGSKNRPADSEKRSCCVVQ